jgi:hypothetical protein
MMGMTHGHTRKYYQTLLDNKKLDWVASCAQDEESKKVYELYKTGVPCYLDPEEMYKKHPDIEAVHAKHAHYGITGLAYFARHHLDIAGFFGIDFHGFEVHAAALASALHAEVPSIHDGDKEGDKCMQAHTADGFFAACFVALSFRYFHKLVLCVTYR